MVTACKLLVPFADFALYPSVGPVAEEEPVDWLARLNIVLDAAKGTPDSRYGLSSQTQISPPSYKF